MDVNRLRMRVLCALCLASVQGVLATTPVWKDPNGVGKASEVFALAGGRQMRVDVLAENIFRIRVKATGGDWTESGMNRYGVIKRTLSDQAPSFTRTQQGLSTKLATLGVSADGRLAFKSRVSPADFAVRCALVGKGYEVTFPLTDDERIYGLGDVSRDNIMRRPGRYEIWVKNVNSYIPMTMALSSRGWGMMMNTTWRNYFDVGKTNRQAMICSAPESDLDFYLFTARDYRGLLDAYTSFSGRPALLPAFGYGFSYVCNQWIDQFSLMQEAVNFRREQIPCDVIGLEPGWMEKFYDNTTRKWWSKQRFYFPYWMVPGSANTWPMAMKRIGFKLSLWLCCSYDLYKYEEQLVAGKAKRGGDRQRKLVDNGVDEVWFDDHIMSTNAIVDPRFMDRNSPMTSRLKWESQFPEGSLPWFEHLKKFVDQGAQCFKLDGSSQVLEWNGVPNRKWANDMNDEEAHNLYPLVYDKQMATGYEDYTARRAMVYSAGGYSGVQQYVATWAGDTGGGAKPCASILNLGMSGHSNQSCDMDVSKPAALHFGFLQTWSQQNNWDYWNQPWIQEPGKVDVFRSYAMLRYRLFPYLYGAAAEAARTGWPVMRSLPFVYPDVPAYDKCMTTYMLGDAFLVAAFTDKVEVPKGLWFDFRTGEAVTGPCVRPVVTCPEWGGALLVKAGAIVPAWPVKQHVENGWNDTVVYEVWPGAEGSAALYEDDGISLGYRTGAYALTPLKLACKPSLALTIGKRTGTFSAMPATHTLSVKFHLKEAPKMVLVNDKPTMGSFDVTTHVFTIDLGDVRADHETTVALQ